MEREELVRDDGDRHAVAVRGDAGAAAHAEHELRYVGDADGIGEAPGAVIGAGNPHFRAATEGGVHALLAGNRQLRLGGLGKLRARGQGRLRAGHDGGQQTDEKGGGSRWGMAHEEKITRRSAPVGRRRTSRRPRGQAGAPSTR